MKKILCLLALPCLFLTAFGQTPIGLSIADKVPDVQLTSIIRHSSSHANLYSFKKKLLILDFWATWCSPCISMFPTADSLEHIFEGEVVFLPVTYESKDKVEKLFSRARRLKDISTPIVIQDQALHKLFPHKNLPHYVWINQDGVVKAITGYQEITERNIRQFLSDTVAMEQKKDVVLQYDRDSPLLFNKAGIEQDDIQYETVFTGYKKGLSSRTQVVRYPDKKFKRFTATNTTRRDLFAYAFSSPNFFFDQNRTIVEVADKLKILLPAADAGSREKIGKWFSENTFCYEILVPPSMSSSIFTLMQEEMGRLFPQYKVFIEKRPIECLVLERTSNVDKIKSSGAARKFSFDHFGATLTNYSIGLLLSQLNGVNLQLLNMPLIDGTKYEGKVDLKLECDLSDVLSIRKALKAYDLDLVQKSVSIDMLIIQDAQPK